MEIRVRAHPYSDLPALASASNPQRIWPHHAHRSCDITPRLRRSRRYVPLLAYRNTLARCYLAVRSARRCCGGISWCGKFSHQGICLVLLSYCAWISRCWLGCGLALAVSLVVSLACSHCHHPVRARRVALTQDSHRRKFQASILCVGLCCLPKTTKCHGVYLCFFILQPPLVMVAFDDAVRLWPMTQIQVARNPLIG